MNNTLFTAARERHGPRFIITGVNAQSSVSATRWLRIARVCLHLLRGLVIAGMFFPLVSRARRRHEVKRWSARLLRILAVRLRIYGDPPRHGTPLMLIANHVSWLDIYAINAVLPARFVAKAEVRRWPLIGWFSEKAGTLYIERARRHDTARLNRLMIEAMQAGDPVAVFPEATTGDGSALLKFHSSLLQPALDARAALHPVAIRYVRSDGTLCTEAAYDGEKTLWDTLLLMVTQCTIDVHVHFLAPVAYHDHHRREIAQAIRDAILRTLYPQSLRSHTDKFAGPRAAAH
jgi:1-acyl-sn-glycerol-3-phosphate acyltransferase